LIAYAVSLVHSAALLQLRAEWERTMQGLRESGSAAPPSDEPAGPTVPLRGYARRLGPAVLAVGAMCSLLMPRGLGGFLGDWQARPARSMTGFSETVDFARAGPISNDDSVVMHVRFIDPGTGEPVQLGAERLYFRAATQERFDGAAWATGTHPGRRTRNTVETELMLGRLRKAADEESPSRRLRQETTLYSAQGPHLFTAGLPLHIESAPAAAEVEMDRFDITLRSANTGLRGVQHYIVDVLDGPPGPIVVGEMQQIPRRRRGAPAYDDFVSYARGWRSGSMARIQATRGNRYETSVERRSRDDAAQERIAEFAETAIRAAGVPADAPVRDKLRALTEHLQNTFTYSLDPPEGIAASRQPMVDFLFEHRSGNCQFFASALVMMCRTRAVDAPARLVTGYHGGEYNGTGGFYAVRARDAHAWVEVWLGPREGWVVFDPTPAAPEESDAFAFLRQFQQMFELVDYRWGELVLSYGETQQQQWVGSVRTWMAEKIISRLPTPGTQEVPALEWLHRERLERIFMVLLAAALIGGGVWRIWRGGATVATRERAKRNAERGESDGGAGAIDGGGELLGALRDAGVWKLPHATLRGLARALAESDSSAFGLLPSAVEHVYRERFGGMPADEPVRTQVEAALAAVRRRQVTPEPRSDPLPPTQAAL